MNISTTILIYFLTAKSAEQAQRTQRADTFIMNALAAGLGLPLPSTNQQINKSTNQPLRNYVLTAKSAEQAQRTQRADAFIMNALAAGLGLPLPSTNQQINLSEIMF
jgi:uncharacterized protein HemY